MYVTLASLPEHTWLGATDFKSAISQRCGTTIVVSWALTDAVPPGPVVPVARAVLISAPVMFTVRGTVTVLVCPGASGPQPNEKSSPALPGVPLSSTRFPEAEKKSPVFPITYP